MPTEGALTNREASAARLVLRLAGFAAPRDAASARGVAITEQQPGCRRLIVTVQHSDDEETTVLTRIPHGIQTWAIPVQ